MDTEGWKSVSMSYDKKHNCISIDAHESDFVPDFLKYLLEYHQIPKDAKRVFLKDVKEVRK